MVVCACKVIRRRISDSRYDADDFPNNKVYYLLNVNPDNRVTQSA